MIASMLWRSGDSNDQRPDPAVGVCRGAGTAAQVGADVLSKMQNCVARAVSAPPT